MNKCISLAVLLTIFSAFAMEKEEDGADFLKAVDAFEKTLLEQATALTKQAYKILSDNSCRTPQEAQRKSRALQFLFRFKPSQVNAMKLIQVEGNKLIFKGNCKDAITRKDFEAIKQGNFCVDLNNVLMPPDRLPMSYTPRLIIGRKTFPTGNEYALHLSVPYEELHQWIDDDTVSIFRASAEKN